MGPGHRCSSRAPQSTRLWVLQGRKRTDQSRNDGSALISEGHHRTGEMPLQGTANHGDVHAGVQTSASVAQCDNDEDSHFENNASRDDSD